MTCTPEEEKDSLISLTNGLTLKIPSKEVLETLHGQVTGARQWNRATEIDNTKIQGEAKEPASQTHERNAWAPFKKFRIEFGLPKDVLPTEIYNAGQEATKAFREGDSKAYSKAAYEIRKEAKSIDNPLIKAYAMKYAEHLNGSHKSTFGLVEDLTDAAANNLMRLNVHGAALHSLNVVRVPAQYGPVATLKAAMSFVKKTPWTLDPELIKGGLYHEPLNSDTAFDKIKGFNAIGVVDNSLRNLCYKAGIKAGKTHEEALDTAKALYYEQDKHDMPMYRWGGRAGYGSKYLFARYLIEDMRAFNNQIGTMFGQNIPWEARQQAASQFAAQRLLKGYVLGVKTVVPGAKLFAGAIAGVTGVDLDDLLGTNAVKHIFNLDVQGFDADLPQITSYSMLMSSFEHAKKDMDKIVAKIRLEEPLEAQDYSHLYKHLGIYVPLVGDQFFAKLIDYAAKKYDEPDSEETLLDVYSGVKHEQPK